MANYITSVREELYALKRDFGFPISFYKTVIGETNLETGIKSKTIIKYEIPLGIVVPIKHSTLAFYSASYLKAAREFAYGGYQDVDTKRIVIDGSDLDVEIEPEDYFIYRHKRYEIKQIKKLEENLGYDCIVKQLNGAAVEEIHTADIYQNLRVLQKYEDLLNG